VNLRIIYLVVDNLWITPGWVRGVLGSSSN